VGVDGHFPLLARIEEGEMLKAPALELFGLCSDDGRFFCEAKFLTKLRQATTNTNSSHLSGLPSEQDWNSSPHRRKNVFQQRIPNTLLLSVDVIQNIGIQ
jgi:hypothetical protein